MPDATTSTRERDGPPTPTLQPNAHTVKPTTDLGMGGGGGFGIPQSDHARTTEGGGGCANKAPGYKDSGVTVPGLFLRFRPVFYGSGPVFYGSGSFFYGSGVVGFGKILPTRATNLAGVCHICS